MASYRNSSLTYKKNKDCTRETEGQSENIQQGKEFLVLKIAEGNQQIIPEHG